MHNRLPELRQRRIPRPAPTSIAHAPLYKSEHAPFSQVVLHDNTIYKIVGYDGSDAVVEEITNQEFCNLRAFFHSFENKT